MANTSFAQLKKNRQSNLAKLTAEVEKLTAKPSYTEEDNSKFWTPTVDKAGNGYAVIRFLPAPKGEDLPFVRIFKHAFQGPTGSWYIENSLTTLGQKDPVGELNQKLWNTGSEEDKNVARKQKRNLQFVSNIYVVKDPGNPANEGKVFLFRYGKKIFDKLNTAMNPEDDDKPMDPFCMWEGANFKLRIRMEAGFRNYDKSAFDIPAPLLENDEELEAIWSQEHSLATFLDPSNFKSYDELKSRLNRVLGLDQSVSTSHEELPIKAAPVAKTKPAPAMATTAAADEDEDLDAFLNKFKDE